MFFDEKKQNIGAAILGHVDPKGEVKDDYEDDDHKEILKSIASDLIAAVHAKDEEAVVQALDAFWQCIQEEDTEQDQGA